MTRPITRRIVSIATCLLLSFSIIAQAENIPGYERKPYHIHTSGKQVTVKSSRKIKNIMVWTASGHRIVEQRGLNLPTYTFNTGNKEKVFFVMIQYEGMKPFTEKVGVE